MGKTTLWRAGVDEAGRAGLLVLRPSRRRAKRRLSFSGLGDLLDPVLDEALAPLAAGQRSALARALVLEDVEGPPPDARAAGSPSSTHCAASRGARGVLVAIDDVQWLDEARPGALAYARRTPRVGERSARSWPAASGLESALVEELRRSASAERFVDLEVGPLDPAALHQLVHAHLGITLPRPLLAEVHQASGGNPFYALEIVRTLHAQVCRSRRVRPLPVPDSLHDLVHGRLLALPPESRDFLLAAAAHAHPTIAITEAASGVDARGRAHAGARGADRGDGR